MSLTWSVVLAIIAGVWGIAWALAYAAGKADEEMEQLIHDRHRTSEAEAARDAARREHVDHPERLHDDDGFRRD